MRKHARVIPFLALVAAPLALVGGGCEAPEAPPPAEQAARDAQPIVNGSLDTVNDAVCALMIAQGQYLSPFCTATIIARDGSTGYALSAAHCVGGLGSNAPLYLMCADSYDDCPGSACPTYEVTHYESHPQYAGEVPHDILMLTFSGASGSTPVIPVAGANDGVGDGDAVEVSGFGLINGYNETPSDARRHAFSVTEGNYSDAFVVPQSYDGPYGGACNGDSGGPLMVGSGSSKRVVGVVSQGDEYCAEVGFYARVEYEYAFIAEYMNQPVPEQNCDQCFNGAVNTAGGECSDELDACLADQPCEGLVMCLQECTSQACVNDCAADHPGGVAGYNAIIDCAYCDACATACASENDFCDGSSGSGPAGSGPTGSGVGATTGSGDVGATTGSGDPLGGGGAGAGGAPADDDDGGKDDDDGGKKDGGGDEASGSETSCSVGVVGGASGSAWGVIAAAAMALAAGRRRRNLRRAL